MSTVSAIIILSPSGDGTCTGIYCHNDGYPVTPYGGTYCGVGYVLLSQYADLEKLTRLIALGSLSSLGPDIESSRAYHRDCGDSYEENKPIYWRRADLARKYCFEYWRAEFVYIFDGTQWTCHENEDASAYGTPLDEVVMTGIACGEDEDISASSIQ